MDLSWEVLPYGKVQLPPIIILYYNRLTHGGKKISSKQCDGARSIFSRCSLLKQMFPADAENITCIKV
jgi:hypothetical protein